MFLVIYKKHGKVMSTAFSKGLTSCLVLCQKARYLYTSVHNWCFLITAIVSGMKHDPLILSTMK